MGAMIVTVSDEKKRFFIDVEVPDLQPVEGLKMDLVETLNGYRPELYLNPFRIDLFSERLRRMLNGHETLAQAGVWNGDYVILVEKRNG